MLRQNVNPTVGIGELLAKPCEAAVGGTTSEVIGRTYMYTSRTDGTGGLQGCLSNASSVICWLPDHCVITCCTRIHASDVIQSRVIVSVFLLCNYLEVQKFDIIDPA